ncbi:MAG: metalloprotease PmbA, partial [Endozoicomonadaceae bacterium]|nr:metalloprotease PmbA [Endozoicomonadaceae bacterium]
DQNLDEIQKKFTDIAQHILHKIKSLSLTACEIQLSFNLGSSTTVRLGQLETLESNKDQSISIVAYNGQKIGHANTSDLSMKTIDQTLEAAKNIAQYTQEDPCAGLAEKNKMATQFLDLDLYHPWNLDHKQAVELASECEQAGLDCSPLLVNSDGATVDTYQGLSVYANSHGFLGTRRSSRHSVSCALLAKKDDEMQQDYWYSLARHAEQLETMSAIGQKAAERTLARLHAKKIKTGIFPVLFQSDIAPSLISHLFSAISGSALYQNASFLNHKINQPIFPSWIDITENPYELQGLASNSFDEDGLQTNKKNFVNQGILSSYLLNVYSGRKLNLPSTANAGGARNIKITHNKNSLIDLMQEMDTGLLVTELMGSSINLITGDYSRGAAGFWIEKGEIQHPVTEITIASTLQEMFQNITSIGNDLDKRHSVQTGSILIDHMTIAGQ